MEGNLKTDVITYILQMEEGIVHTPTPPPTPHLHPSGQGKVVLTTNHNLFFTMREGRGGRHINILKSLLGHDVSNYGYVHDH